MLLAKRVRYGFYGPTPLPCRGKTPHASRHGFGYSVSEHTEDGVSPELVGLHGSGRKGQVQDAQSAPRVS